MDTAAPAAPFLDSFLATARQHADAEMFAPANAGDTVDRIEDILTRIDARLALLEQRLDQAGVPHAAEISDDEWDRYITLPSLRGELAP